ncbi:hypothetical protein D3C78_1238400 [compost metagenome]
MIKARPQLALSLQQQGLWVAGQLASCQQLIASKALQVVQARTYRGRQALGQLLELLLEGCRRLHRRSMAQRIAAAQVILDVACCLILELLRQRQVPLHDLIRALQRPLRPPQGGTQGDTDSYQQQGVEIG